MGRALTAHGEDRRAQLLDAAAELFAQRGYDQTRIADIATAAGVAKGLLYWYFSGKEALLAELVGDLQWRLRRLQGRALRDVAGALERLYVGALVAAPFVDEHYHLYVVLHSASRRRPAASGADTIALHAQDTARVLAEGQRGGVVRDAEPPELLAYGVSALVNELVRFGKLGVLPGGPTQVAAVAARACVHLVATQRTDAEAVVADHPRLAAAAAAALAGSEGPPGRPGADGPWEPAGPVMGESGGRGEP
ncbi:MAG TPA: TetR/AcrR family transcriptional regulator [Acidimicrobiales bacterium]|nr:TetR/AcrR family transcriptional regulator [Acidimicrobiales bacterium]